MGGGWIVAEQGHQRSEIAFSVKFASSKFSRSGPVDDRHTYQGTHPLINRVALQATKNSSDKTLNF